MNNKLQRKREALNRPLSDDVEGDQFVPFEQPTTPLTDRAEQNTSGEMQNNTPPADVDRSPRPALESSLLPASEMIDRELVQLALESHARALMYPNSKVQHDRANECAMELLRRLSTRSSDASRGNRNTAWQTARSLATKIERWIFSAPDSWPIKGEPTIGQLTAIILDSTTADASEYVRGLSDAAVANCEFCLRDDYPKAALYGDAWAHRDENHAAWCESQAIRALISQQEVKK